MESFAPTWVAAELPGVFILLNSYMAWRWIQWEVNWINGVFASVLWILNMLYGNIIRKNGASKHYFQLAMGKGCIGEMKTVASIGEMKTVDSIGEMKIKRWIGVWLPLVPWIGLRIMYPKVIREDSILVKKLAGEKKYWYQMGKSELVMDVYHVADGRLKPVFVYIHGGGMWICLCDRNKLIVAWMVGHRQITSLPLLYHLANSGWIVCAIEYRFSPKSKMPQHIIDCKRAIQYLRETHHALWNVDRSFIACGGDSSGGHLALMLALTENEAMYQPGFENTDTSIQACIDLFGVHDLTDLHDQFLNRDANNGFIKFLETIVLQKSSIHKLDFENASPIHQLLKKDKLNVPPLFSVHGMLDSVVPVEDTIHFVHALRQHRLKTKNNTADVFVQLPHAHHAFSMVVSPRSIALSDAVHLFLTHHYQQHSAKKLY